MGRVLGLLGGIGSGKSSVAALLAAHGLLVLDADAEARAVVEQPAVREALAQRFGPSILDAQGRLLRARLAELAFADAASTAALNAIVHPAVRARLTAALAATGERPVVLDVPLLAESPLSAAVTDWIFVEAPEALREERVATRGWAPGERARREARQTPLAAKRAAATRTLENSGDLRHLERQVTALLAELDLP